MGVQGVYTYTGAACLAAGVNCWAHGLPTTPDWAVPIPRAAAGSAAALSLPIHLVSRGTTGVIAYNPNPAMDGELVAQYLHSIIR